MILSRVGLVVVVHVFCDTISFETNPLDDNECWARSLGVDCVEPNTDYTVRKYV